ncbi:MAG: hypothetical protein ABSA59_15345 [Terriglobia bacterium]
MRTHLDRFERLNPKLNVFVDCQPEAVLAQSRCVPIALAVGLNRRFSLALNQ